MSNIQILNENLFNISKYCQPRTVDLIIFDPPYGIGDNKLEHKSKNWHKSSEAWDVFDSIEDQYNFYVKCLNLLVPLLKQTGSMWIFGSFHNIFLIGEILQRHLKFNTINTVVWHKTNAMFSMTRRSLIEGNEYLIWASQNKNYFFNYESSKILNSGKQMRNIWHGSAAKAPTKLRHPHQKPLWLIDRIISISCPNKGLVVDPMAGSGVTAIAAFHKQLDCICFEIKKEFYKTAQNALQARRSSYLF